MTRVLVGIPWRPQPHRVYAHDLTVRRYRDLLPDAHIVDVDTDHDPFCLAACRNRAVKMAEAGGYDIVVLADADTLPEMEPLHRAIGIATLDARFGITRVHLPYTEYRSLGRDGTDQALDGIPLDHCSHVTIPFATSGVYVTTPATWWACGGQDEHMLGWGMEDVAWLVAHRLLLGAEPARHEGRVYALHHESAVKQGDQYERNVARYHRYLAAAEAGDLEAVRALTSKSVTCDESALSTAGQD